MKISNLIRASVLLICLMSFSASKAAPPLKGKVTVSNNQTNTLATYTFNYTLATSMSGGNLFLFRTFYPVTTTAFPSFNVFNPAYSNIVVKINGTTIPSNSNNFILFQSFSSGNHIDGIQVSTLSSVNAGSQIEIIVSGIITNPSQSGIMPLSWITADFQGNDYDKFTATTSFTLNCSPSSSTTNTSICSSQLPYSWNGLTFNAAGTQTAHLTNAGGCDSAASLTISLKPSPNIGVSIGGNICGIGGTLSVYNTNTLNGGVWTSSNTNIATVSTASNGAGGLATGVNKGTVVLTYTKTSSANGCAVSASCIVNVIAPTITGAATICRGNTAQLSVTETGGYWASNNNKANVSSTGLVTGVNAGNASISYVMGGCLNTNAFTPTIFATPAAPTISYAVGSINPQLGAGSAYCNNRTFTLVGTPAGGVWSSTNTNVITVTSGGVASTIGVGSGSVVYTFSNATGCSSSRSIVGTVVGCAPRGVNSVDGQLSTVDGFTMYPNPAKSVININVETLVGKGSIIVTDLYGKTVKTQTLSMGTNTVDIANLSKGMYFVSTITNEGKTTKKLVVE